MKKFIIKNKYKITKPLYRGNNKVNNSLFCLYSANIIAIVNSVVRFHSELSPYRLPFADRGGWWALVYTWQYRRCDPHRDVG